MRREMQRDESKRVCLLSSAHRALDTRIFHKQARSLADAGYPVTLVAQHDRDEVVDGVEILALPRARNRLRRFMGLWKMLGLARSCKARIYHFHDPDVLPVGLLLKALAGAKIVYDIHEDYPKDILMKQWIPRWARHVVSGLYSLAEGLMFPLLDAVVVAGEDIGRRFEGSPKVSFIANYPSVDGWTKMDVPARNNRVEAPAAIYVGALTADRCLLEMVEATMLLKGRARLVLLGTFSDRDLETRIRTHASAHVEIHSQVPHEQVKQYLRESCVGLVCFHPHPNNVSAVSRNNKLYEYMAAGLPVVVSDFPAWRSFVEDNGCGVTVDPLEPSEIANAVQYLIEHQADACRMGENGRSAVLERYNWEREREKLLALYSRLL